ncbi:hypothetical protein [Methylobacterium ajmalii]|jgi:hypothetical protein|uniref:hypothetical protein n=1 Tax=Methylobacterium ajmalii TaxID=2738439 RepID=UPI00190CCBF4|nr:hypothetical protein [Methylobacterium ajmalii]MBK3397702.1 hypothetical protein [Methylobacterium ajmalii]MBK3411693.1 hypothetical protein [Methylobacterium ajmalii]MBK3425448.1 hypothetical protein [Methylobacterium ajmalii]MBZ6414792.1 hypothetical protein [Methylobacterium sp.]
MSFRSFFASVMRAAFAAMACAPRLVWDGTRFVLRAAASLIPTPPQEEAVAEEELMAELNRPREILKADVVEPDVREEWGYAAGNHLVSCGEPTKGVLDERAIAYLDALDIEERAALLAYEARHIGQHLMGERMLKGLPKVPTLAEWTAAEKARLAALAGPVRERRALIQAKVDEVAAVMREHGYEPVTAPRPRAA